MGERGLDGGDVPQVRARQGLLHADPDALGRRAHDDVLQVLQAGVRPQMEGLSGSSSDDMAGKRAVQTLVVPVVAKGTNGSVFHFEDQYFLSPYSVTNSPLHRSQILS